MLDTAAIKDIESGIDIGNGVGPFGELDMFLSSRVRMGAAAMWWRERLLGWGWGKRQG